MIGALKNTILFRHDRDREWFLVRMVKGSDDFKLPIPNRQWCLKSKRNSHASKLDPTVGLFGREERLLTGGRPRCHLSDKQSEDMESPQGDEWNREASSNCMIEGDAQMKKQIDRAPTPQHTSSSTLILQQSSPARRRWLRRQVQPVFLD